MTEVGAYGMCGGRKRNPVHFFSNYLVYGQMTGGCDRVWCFWDMQGMRNGSPAENLALCKFFNKLTRSWQPSFEAGDFGWIIIICTEFFFMFTRLQ